VIVFAYQTDHTGVYNRRGADGWRLHGGARTDAEGRFELHTIRAARSAPCVR
jgi:protocatechuate 3,4-dioxygenase beta subunit